MLNGGPDLSQGPKLRVQGPQALSAAPRLPALPTLQPGDPGLEPHERADLGSNLKPASESRSPGDLVSVHRVQDLTGTRRNPRLEPILGEADVFMAHPLPGTSPTPSFPIVNLVFGLPARLPDVLPTENSPLSGPLRY